MTLLPRKPSKLLVRPLAVPVRQQLILVGAILFLLLGSAATTKLATLFSNKEPEPHVENPYTTTEQTEVEEDPFAQVNIVGKAAFVFDVNRGEVLYSSAADEELPLASVTKLMTAMVAHELLSENASVQISQESLRQDGYSNLLLDEYFSRQTLSDLTLISSTNDGAYALAAAAGAAISESEPATAFVEAMNIRAEEIGLKNTYFKNPSGLDIDETTAGSYGSARDITMLMQHILINYPELLTYTTKQSSTFVSENGYTHEGVNTNYYVDEIPGLIGSKTGYTALAGGNLVIAFDAGLNRPIIVTVLGSTRHERFTDVMQLVDAATTYITNQS